MLNLVIATKMRHRVVYILLLLFCAFPSLVDAQRVDIPSIEAMISDHKRIKGPIEARAALEIVNKELHDNSKKEVSNYKDINDQLDKYTRCLDILNIVYNSLSTAVNFYNTYNDVTDKLNSIYDLLERYRACIIVKQLGQVERTADILSGVTDIHSIGGAKEWYRDVKELYEEGTVIIPEDTVVFTICRDMVVNVKKKCDEIFHSMLTLVGYATGVMACTTEGLLSTINGLNDQITGLRQIVDKSHFLLWRYIHLRTGYWSRAVLWQHKTVNEHARDALQRWRNVTYEAMNRTVSRH